MKIVRKEMYRLYDLSEIQIEGCRHYKRAPFPNLLSNILAADDDFNHDVDAEYLDEVLDDLADATYGEDRCGRSFEITDDMRDCNRKIRVQIEDDERLEIQDITDRILDFSEHTRLFILVDEQLTEYKWVVADPKGTVYSDADEDEDTE